MRSSGAGLAIANPLPLALRHFSDEIEYILRAAKVDSRGTLSISTEGRTGVRRVFALVRYASRLLSTRGDLILVWPLVGYLDVLIASLRRGRTHLIIHDPLPLRRQVGLGRRSAWLARSLLKSARSRVSIVVLSESARIEVATALAVEPRVLPHPTLPQLTARGVSEIDREFDVLVLGQNKDARDLDILLAIGEELERRGLKGLVAGRGWPNMPGWRCDSRFLSESEFEGYLRKSKVLILPYVHYFQSGVAIRAVECGTPVVGLDHPFLRELLGSGYAGFVPAEGSAVDWVDACERAARVELGARSEEYLSRCVSAWSALSNPFG